MKFRLVENIEEFAWLENFDNVKDISNEEFVRQVLSNRRSSCEIISATCAKYVPKDSFCRSFRIPGNNSME